MKNMKTFSVRPLSGVIIGVALLPGSLLAAEQAGHVLAASGSIKAIGSDGKTRDLSRRSPVYSGDRLLTARSANAQVKFTDGAIVALKPSTELSVDEYAYEEGGLQKAFMSLVKGGFRTLTGAIGKTDQADYRVTTPVATIGIRGTLYDLDFDPETGLGMAAWEGGIRACRGSDCVNLGRDANYRFGRIGLNGSFSGSDRPANSGGGSGEGDSTSDDSAGEGDSGQPTGDTPVSTTDVNAVVSGETSGTTTTPPPPIILPTRAGFPLTGYAVAGTVNGSNPWGSKPGISLDFARLQPVSPGAEEFYFAGTGSPLRSGQYLLSGWQECDHCSTDPMPGLPFEMPIGETSVYWSWWDADSEWSEFSLSNNPDKISANGVFNPGIFILGNFATPSVVSQMTGTVEFFDVVVEGFRNGDPHGGAAYGGGEMLVNLANQSASGNLWLVPEDTSIGYEYWNLNFSGPVSTSGFKLGLTPWSPTTESGSYVTRWPSSFNYSDYQDVGLLGTVEGRFVGQSRVDGIVGSFDVRTDESSPETLRGIFGLERDEPYVPLDPSRFLYPLHGFMASAPSGWPGQILLLEYADFARYDGGEVPMWAMQAWGGQLGAESQVVSGWNDGVDPCVTDTCMSTLMPSVWESNPGGPDNTTVYWGAWNGAPDVGYGGNSDLSLSSDFLPTTDGVYNPGLYVFGTYATPDVVSKLAGSTTFYYQGGMMSVDGGQGATATGSGMLTVDLGSGQASGSLQLQNPFSPELWSLDFSGTATTAGLDLFLQPMGSFVDRDGATVGIDVSSSSLDAGFVGATDVHGVIGSFDVNTQEVSPVNAQGVFVYGLPGGT